MHSIKTSSKISRRAGHQSSLFLLSPSLAIAHLLRGCCEIGMCCDATCEKENVIGESVLHLSVYQPPVIRTLHMKAMTDMKGKNSEMED